MLGAAFIYRITHAEEGAKMLIDAGGLPALVACWEAGCWEAAGVGEALGEEAARQRQHGYRGQGTGYRVHGTGYRVQHGYRVQAGLYAAGALAHVAIHRPRGSSREMLAAGLVQPLLAIA